MTYTPLHDYIVVEEIKEETSLILPDGAKQDGTLHRVLAVGNGTRTIAGVLVPLDLLPGDIVILGQCELNRHVSMPEGVFFVRAGYVIAYDRSAKVLPFVKKADA